MIAYLSLLQIGGLFGDLELVLKIVGMLFIISFVRSHIQHPILSVGIIIALCAFLLFDVWKIFGGVLLLYLIALFGFLHIFIDLSFMHAFSSPILNIGGMFRGKPKPMPGPPHGGRMPGYEPDEYETSERIRGEREREFGPEEEQHGEYGGAYEPEHAHPTQRRMDPREEAKQRYEQAMRHRMNQIRGKRDDRR
ncbi:MAG: hypothetical protein AABW68_00560 [archaeon]|mgnify:FL=1